jgi:GTPase SAR1 family protein
MIRPIFNISETHKSNQVGKDLFNPLLDNQNVHPLILETFNELPQNFRIPYLSILTAYKIANFSHFQPFMIVITGPSGCGKTSLFDLFQGKKFFSVDVITPASFASHYASARKETLQKEIDLIPKIRSKIVFFKEMSSVFADYRKGREFISIYTRILDGGSFTKVSGVHAPTTYTNTNHISFGAVTNVNKRIFKLISEIGPRIFFLKMEGGSKILNFRALMDGLKNKTKEVLKEIDELPVSEIDETDEKKIERLAGLLAVFRAIEPRSETPHRINSVFIDIFRASESILKGFGLQLLKRLVQDSLPQERFDALCDLIQHGRLTGRYHLHGVQIFYSEKLKMGLQKFLKESSILNTSGNLVDQWRWLHSPGFVKFWFE